MDILSTSIIQVAASQKVHIGPCIIYSITIAADGANADCQIKDGVTSAAPERLHLETLSGTSHTLAPAIPFKLNKGIYVVVNATTTHVSITYLPLLMSDN